MPALRLTPRIQSIATRARAIANLAGRGVVLSWGIEPEDGALIRSMGMATHLGRNISGNVFSTKNERQKCMSRIVEMSKNFLKYIDFLSGIGLAASGTG
jgi:hypothetical protein